MKRKIEDVKNNTFVILNGKLYILFEKDNREQEGLVLSLSQTIENDGIFYGTEVQIPNKIEIKYIMNNDEFCEYTTVITQGYE